jgi:hypothetical protein
MVIATSGSVSCPSTTIGEGVAGDVGAVGTGVTEAAPSTSSWSPPGESTAVAEVGDTVSDETSSPASLLLGLSGGPPSSPPSPPSPRNKIISTPISTHKLAIACKLITLCRFFLLLWKCKNGAQPTIAQREGMQELVRACSQCRQVLPHWATLCNHHDNTMHPPCVYFRY